MKESLLSHVNGSEKLFCWGCVQAKIQLFRPHYNETKKLDFELEIPDLGLNASLAITLDRNNFGYLAFISKCVTPKKCETSLF